MRYTYLKGKPIETLYFGGGTPSQLDEKDFRKVFDTVRRIYGMENCHEITLEANPDDLCPEYLQMLSNCRSTASAWASRHLTTLRSSC